MSSGFGNQQQQQGFNNGGNTGTTGGNNVVNSPLPQNNNAAGAGGGSQQQLNKTNTTDTKNTSTTNNGATASTSTGDISNTNTTTVATTNPQQQQQSKELNAASLCRYGQETVQEIVSRTQELYQTLRGAQPPDGKQNAIGGIDRKPKFQETLRNIRALFKRLRVIYDKIGESFPDSEDLDLEEFIPYHDPTKPSSEISNRLKEKQDTEAYKLAMEEYHEVTEQVIYKNRHLRETMDLMRNIIWDINTMLAMRKE